jgi:non-specific serine/threonine protein kinase/serine/threonine-protein kinase
MDQTSAPRQHSTASLRQSQWRAVTDLFDRCLGSSSEERERLLAAANDEIACEVRSLLENANSDGESIQNPVEEILGPPQSKPRQFGPYRVERLLGQGGMGSVFLAKRVGEFEQLVAVKLIRQDFGLAAQVLERRFQQERQILASLQHPNIAHLIDGGTSDSHPYLVVEYVPGVRIDDYCNRNRLSIRQRIELFLKICSAVQYAHQQLVVHRDLKPANVLVLDDGTPKLLDFGIAKLMREDLSALDLTRTAMRVFTPSYASPEQLRGGPAGTASDVYSLGVMLYELLTGQRPHSVDSDSDLALLDAVCNQTPTLASAAIKRHPEDSRETEAAERATTFPAWNKTLRGDLDLILLRAISADISRRYQSVEQFSADLDRYLANRPITARKDSWTYRAQKYWSRHKALVSVTSFALVILLVAGIALWHEYRIANEQRLRAERRFNDVRAVSHDLIFPIHDSIQYLAGATQARKLVVQSALRYLNALSKDAPDDIRLQEEIATAYDKVGEAQGGIGKANLGDTAGALESHKKALEIRKSIFASRPNDPSSRDGLIHSYQQVGSILQDMGRNEESLEYNATHLELSKELVAASPHNDAARSRLAASYNWMGDILSGLGRSDDSLKNYEASAQIYKELSSSGFRPLISQRNWALERKKIGSVLEVRGEMQLSLQEFRSALAVDEDLARADPQDASNARDVSIDYASLANVMLELHDIDGAIQHYQRALVIDRRLAAADREDASARYHLVRHSYHLGDAFLKSSQTNKAIAVYREALSSAERNANSDPENILMRSELARVYARLAKAEFNSAMSQSVNGPDRQKSLAEARTFYEKSLSLWVELRNRNVLGSNDLGEREQVAKELSACNSEIKRAH